MEDALYVISLLMNGGGDDSGKDGEDGVDPVTKRAKINTANHTTTDSEK